MKKKVIAIAAGIVLTMSVAVFAAGKGSWGFNEYQENGESSYEMHLNVETVSNDYFTGPVTKVKDIVLKQIEEYEPYMNQYPLSYSKKFNSIDAAFKYMGADSIEHPFENELEVLLNVECNDSGDIKCISLESDYELDGCRLQVFNHIYTEEYDTAGAITITSNQLGDVDYTRKTGILGSGAEADIIISSQNERGTVNVNAYFVKGEVVYNINVISTKSNTDKAVELMNKILELY